MKLLFQIFFFLFCVAAEAQVVEVSNPTKLPPKSGKFKIIGKNNDGIIVRLFGSQDVIDVYDESLRLQTAKTIDYKNEDGLLQHIMLNKTGAVIFYLHQEKKYSVLFAQPVSSKFVEIGKAITLDTIFDRKDLVSSNLRFKQSVDQSYLMIFYPYFRGSKIESIKFICADRGLSIFYNKTVPVQKDEKEMESSKPLIDNAGNAFLILKPEDKGDGSNFDVLRLDSKGDFSNYSIHTQKEIFGEPSFEIDNKNGNLVLTGFYNDHLKAGEETANGFLYASFDPANGTPVKTNYIPFSKEFIAELTGRKTVTNQSLFTFIIRKTILRNDGGALIVAESFIKDTRDIPINIGIQPGFNNYRSSTVFEFNDIIAFSINSSGEMEWNSVMRKKQASEDDNGYYSSFLVANEKEKLRFLYLDEISGTATLNDYILTSDGKNSRAIVLNQEDKDVMLLPKMGKQVSPSEVVIPSYKNGALRLVKIIL